MLRLRLATISVPCLVVATALVATGSPATAAPPIGLGVATSFGVLAGSTVTNSGPSVVTGDLGVSPGTAVTGFDEPGGPGSVIDGAIHKADALASQAQSAVTTAYIQAANSPTSETVTNTNLGNRTLQPGVYTDTSDMDLTGTLTLDGGGDPAAVFIFQAGSSLIVAGSSTVAFIGAAQPCNVFWQVTSSATIGTAANFAGTVLALTDINVLTGATIQGRLFARNGQVTLLTNVITRPTCAVAPPATSTPTPTPSASATASPSPTSTNSPNGGGGGGNGGGNGGGSGGSGSGSGSGGSGSGSGTGTGVDTPIVPTGHPETGRSPGQGHESGLWLAGGIVCLIGAGAAAVRSTRRRVTLPGA